LNIAWLFWEVVNMCMLVASDGAMCSSELVVAAMSTAVRAASSASLEPSVANRIVVGKIII